MLVGTLRRFIKPVNNIKAYKMFSSSLIDNYHKMLKSDLKQVDKEMYDICKGEEMRQKHSLCLIASENFTSTAVYQTLGSQLQNKYAEGYIDARYYGGCKYIDQLEQLCINRALEVYDLDPEEWGVNVQCYSGSPANLYAYYGVVGKGARIVALDLNHGGHLSHGFETPKKKVSATADYFEWMFYHQNPVDNSIDYDGCQDIVKKFRPKMVVAGYSSYPRFYNYERMREISDSVGAYL